MEFICFKKIKYFGSFWGMSKLKKLDLGNNPTLECVFLKNVNVEDDTIFENLKEVNVSKCKNLRVIDIEQAGEKFTELDLSSNDKLNSLGLEGLRGLKQLKMPETEHRVRRRMFHIQEYFHNTRQICLNRPQCCSTPAAAPYQQASEELPVRR